GRGSSRTPEIGKRTMAKKFGERCISHWTNETGGDVLFRSRPVPAGLRIGLCSQQEIAALVTSCERHPHDGDAQPSNKRRAAHGTILVAWSRHGRIPLLRSL